MISMTERLLVVLLLLEMVAYPSSALVPQLFTHQVAARGWDRRILDAVCMAGTEGRSHPAAPQFVEEIAIASPQRRSKESTGWWRDIKRFREAFDTFREDNNLSMDRIPSERILRAKPGGMVLIHAMRMLGGVEEVSQLIGARIDGRQKSRTRAWKEGGKKDGGQQQQDEQEAKATRAWGRFANEQDMMVELVRFHQAHSNNEREWGRVMPSSAQLRIAGRKDLSSAVDRYGGEEALSQRFNMLSSKEYAYFCEFFTLLLELQAYIRDSGASGHMPTLKQLRDDGRSDIARLVTKHGGMYILAARLDLVPAVSKASPAEPLCWGPFDLAFAVEVLQAAQSLALAKSGGKDKVVMPTRDQLAALGRGDLNALVEKFGGHADVGRRLGLAAQEEAGKHL